MLASILGFLTSAAIGFISPKSWIRGLEWTTRKFPKVYIVTVFTTFFFYGLVSVFGVRGTIAVIGRIRDCVRKEKEKHGT